MVRFCSVVSLSPVDDFWTQTRPNFARPGIEDVKSDLEKEDLWTQRRHERGRENGGDRQAADSASSRG